MKELKASSKFLLDAGRRFTEAASTLSPLRRSRIRRVLVSCNVRQAAPSRPPSEGAEPRCDQSARPYRP